jgi:predicted membrane-bound spermidine synthase
VLALTVAGTALVLSPYRRVFVLSGVAVIAALAALLPGYTRILSVDTRYQRAFISTAVDGPTGRPIRTLSTDPFGVQGAVFTDGDGVVFRYIRFFRLGESLGIPVNRTLTIGGAVYSWPRDFLARNAQSHATVIELDPGMTDIARRHFGLGDDARMTIVHEDGRVFLNRSRERFDAIYLDAFSGTTIPFQLLTREAVGRMSDLLVPGGVVIANLIGSVTGPTSALVQSAGATFNEVFPFVYLFPLGTEPTAPQNIILLASETDLTDVLAAAVDPLGGETLQPIMPSGGQVLTDDRAPVEQMTARLFF